MFPGASRVAGSRAPSRPRGRRALTAAAAPAASPPRISRAWVVRHLAAWSVGSREGCARPAVAVSLLPALRGAGRGPGRGSASLRAPRAGRGNLRGRPPRFSCPQNLAAELCWAPGRRRVRGGPAAAPPQSARLGRCARSPGSGCPGGGGRARGCLGGSSPALKCEPAGGGAAPSARPAPEAARDGHRGLHPVHWGRFEGEAGRERTRVRRREGDP